jgi:hypothetical protein
MTTASATIEQPSRGIMTGPPLASVWMSVPIWHTSP